jgi:HlyD family secretion protein
MKRLLGILVALSLGGCEPPDEMTASGTIEFTQTDVAGTVPSRVDRILVEEGATVRAGDTLAILTQTGLPEDNRQRSARLAAAESELQDLIRGARPAELDRARAELRSAESEAERTAADSLRSNRLLDAGGISQSVFDASASAARVAGARRDAAREALNLLAAGARPDRIAAARASVSAARAQLAAGEAAAGAIVLTAPSDGQVMARFAEPGEVIGAGIPVLSLGDARRAWVRVYVRAPVFATVRIGDRIPLTIDGLTGASFVARVVALATEAEFTPRVALTEKERADLLFGVKLELSDTTGLLNAGLPATARFESGSGGRMPGGNKDGRDSSPDRDP